MADEPRRVVELLAQILSKLEAIDKKLDEAFAAAGLQINSWVALDWIVAYGSPMLAGSDPSPSTSAKGGLMNDTLEKIREAYAQVGRDQPAEFSPLPAWEALSREPREAFISIYHRGRRDGLSEELGAR
jgi:hypothetical protein